MVLIARKHIEDIPNTHLAKYAELNMIHGRVYKSIVTISYLWDRDNKEIEKNQHLVDHYVG